MPQSFVRNMSNEKTHTKNKKSLKPKLRFQEFKDEWEKPRLGDRMEIFRGASPRPQGDPRYYGGTIPRLMIQDVTRDGKYAYPKLDFLTDEGAKKSRLLKKGSIVLSCSGTRVAIPGILGVDACIHDGCPLKTLRMLRLISYTTYLSSFMKECKGQLLLAGFLIT